MMLITVGGQMVRIEVKGIRAAGRVTQGVKLINLEAGDKLQGIAPVISDEIEAAAESASPDAATLNLEPQTPPPSDPAPPDSAPPPTT
jgi:DNA gyrase subunit A